MGGAHITIGVSWRSCDLGICDRLEAIRRQNADPLNQIDCRANGCSHGMMTWDRWRTVGARPGPGDCGRQFVENKFRRRAEVLIKRGNLALPVTNYRPGFVSRVGPHWAHPKVSGDRRVPLARSPGPAHGPRPERTLRPRRPARPRRRPGVEQEAAHRGIEVEIGCPPSRLPKLRHDLLHRNLDGAIQTVVQPELHKSPVEANGCANFA